VAVERRNPLPAGRYWLDVFGEQRAKFTAWRLLNGKAVRVLATESHDTDPPRDWVRFDTTAPVPWEAAFGFPTIVPAGADVTTSGQTVQRPDPEPEFLDTIDAKKLEGTVFTTAGIVVGLGILWLGFQVVIAAKAARGKPA
jgi:hypothetical protein